MIKAIETRYKGYRFRSRLEARWAVFFDALGVRWEYEPQGFDLGPYLGKYLPDFWMPDQDCWIEIKGSFDSGAHEELCESKMRALCEGTKKGGYLFVGNPWENDEGMGCDPMPCVGEAFIVIEWNGEIDIGQDFGHQWCDCGICGAAGIEYGMRNDSLCNCDPGDKYHRTHPNRMLNALVAARSARFEHGENPTQRPWLQTR
jgi:hypothetical protein